MPEAKVKKSVEKNKLRYLSNHYGSGKAAHLNCAEMDYRGWKIELVPIERKLTPGGYSIIYIGCARNETERLYPVSSGYISSLIPEIKSFIRDKIKERKQREKEMLKQIAEEEAAMQRRFDAENSY